MRPSRKRSTFCCCVAPVEKRILLFTVAVNVAVDDNLFVLYFRDLMHQGLCEINFRVELPAWDDPLPIQVDTGN